MTEKKHSWAGIRRGKRKIKPVKPINRKELKKAVEEFLKGGGEITYIENFEHNADQAKYAQKMLNRLDCAEVYDFLNN